MRPPYNKSKEEIGNLTFRDLEAIFTEEDGRPSSEADVQRFLQAARNAGGKSRPQPRPHRR